MNSRAERRRMEKLAKKVGMSQMKTRNLEGEPLPGGTWEYKPHVEPKRPDPVEGVDYPPVYAYHNQMVESNTWYDRDKLPEWIQAIELFSREDVYEEDGNTLKPGCVDWSWARNHACKYVDIRIDMRDGGFVVRNQNGERICLEQLKWQYQFKKDSE